MRALTIATCAVITAALTATAPAIADTTSVSGTNSYKRLVVDNANKTLTFKLTAPGPGCEKMQYLTVKFRDRDGTKYAIDGGCYGAKWARSLVRGEKLVECAGYTLRFNSNRGVWTAEVPRSCLKGLGSAVKVTESYIQDYSARPGEVPATKYVAQG